MNTEAKTNLFISLANKLDELYREHLKLNEMPEKTSDFLSEVMQLVKKNESNIKKEYSCEIDDEDDLWIRFIIRYESGYTMFIEYNNDDGYFWEVIRIEHDKVKDMVKFDALSGNQMWKKIVLFETFYCVFHNSYYYYAKDPYVCVYGYDDLKRKIKISVEEAEVYAAESKNPDNSNILSKPDIHITKSGFSGRALDDRNMFYNKNFKLFYNALQQKGLNIEMADESNDCPSCLIYKVYEKW